MRCLVLATKDVDKDLSKLHPSDRKKAVETIKKLSNPLNKSLKSRKMIETKNFWRVRVGKVKL